MLATAKKINIVFSEKVAHSIIAIVVAIMCTITFFISTELIREPQEVYSTSLAYRLQTESFFQGKLSLFSSPTNLTYDYVFFDGKAQQVWGLGVPLLRMPFEIFHYTFPDRIIAATYFFFMCIGMYFALIKLLKIQGRDPIHYRWAAIYGVTLVYTVAFLRPVFSLARTRFAVYEEAVWYLYVMSLLLFVGMFFVTSKRIGFLYSLSFIAGVGLLLRPTMLAYSIATLGCIVLVSRLTKKQLGIVGLLFILGGSIVAGTNYVRFGSVTEFGHGLNVDADPVNNYQLKFEYPYTNVSLLNASKELGYSIFAHKSYGTNGVYITAYEGQAQSVRWRNFYSDTFTLLHLFFFVTTIILISHAGWRLYSHKGLPAWMSMNQLQVGLWGIISFGVLFVFYLYSPSIASRYIVDFSASIMATILFVALVIFNISRLLQTRIVLIIACVFFVIGTLGTTVDEIKGSATSHATTKEKIMKSSSVTPKFPVPQKASVDNGIYTQEDILRDTKIFFNGIGWNTKTGVASSSVLLFINPVDYIEMDFKGICTETASILQAKIGNDYIVPTIKAGENTLHASFVIPSKYKEKTWPIFFKLLPVEKVTRSTSDCKLMKVTW